jgi:hypothetical protein
MERKGAGEEGRRASPAVTTAERGERTPTLKNATAITRAFGAQVDGLLRDARARGKAEGHPGTGPGPRRTPVYQ